MRKNVFFIFLLITTTIFCGCTKTSISENNCIIEIISFNVVNTTATTSVGGITVFVNGSSKTEYQINGGTFQTSNTFENLAQGSYTINIKNADGCKATKEVSIGIVNQCFSLNISGAISGQTATSSCTSADAGFTIAGNGGTAPYTYSRDGINFQTTGIFTTLSQGAKNITVKDANGCTGVRVVTIAGPPVVLGPLYTAVRQVLQSNCIGCHSGNSPAAGLDFNNNCNVLNNKTKINNRAVLGTPSPMPASGLMPIAERNKITAWLNAGGLLTN